MIRALLTGLRRAIRWGPDDLRRTTPVHPDFGYRRGTPVDRHYIGRFLALHAGLIRGRTLEVAELRYTDGRFGDVGEAWMLRLEQMGERVVVGDLCDPGCGPEGFFDCLVITQTLNFLPDPQTALAACCRMLRPGGHLLMTVAGPSVPVSRYDAERWGDFWRFTDQGIRLLVERAFAGKCGDVHIYGNALAATAMVHGFVTEEFSAAELDVKDPLFQVIVGVAMQKPEAAFATDAPRMAGP